MPTTQPGKKLSRRKRLWHYDSFQREHPNWTAKAHFGALASIYAIRYIFMAIDMAFRRKAVSTLPSAMGVYVLCDLDHVPIYVGESPNRRLGNRLGMGLSRWQ